jgi:hypothetical protein
MATKLLTTSELSTATYGKFSRFGVRVDLNGFFGTNTGKKVMSELRQSSGANSPSQPSLHQESKPK